MKRFVEGLDRGQETLFPETLEDFVDENNAVRVVEAFVEGLDLGTLGFSGVDPKVPRSVPSQTISPLPPTTQIDVSLSETSNPT